MRSLVVLGFGLALTASVHAGTLGGEVTDQATHEPLAGVTVVVSAVGGDSETAITEADGRFTVEVPEGRYTVTYYYGDTTVERHDVAVNNTFATDLRQPLDTTQREIYWGCDFGPPPLYDGEPWDHTERDPRYVPLLRAHDHHGLAGLDARLAPRHSVTTIGGALRLPGAPEIASELVTSIATASTAPAIAVPGATGGSIDAALVHGSNQHVGGVALELGPRARFVARHGGPIEEDHVWWSTGVVLERASGHDDRSGRHGAQVLATLDANTDSGSDVGMGAAGLATWMPDGGRDLWADGQARLLGDDAKRELTIGITAESLAVGTDAPRARSGVAGPAAIDRVAGRAALTQRGRWHGNHTVTVGGELGFGHADDVEHGDLRAFVGDQWLPRPPWTITSGVRWERREVGARRVDAVLPRLTVAWDPTDEGTRMWFATAERVGALDQDRFGAWRGGALGADQASIGYVRDWLDDVRVTLSARARRAVTTDDDAPIERGAEVEVRWLPMRRFAGEVTASSLTRRLVAQASYAVERGRTTTAIAAIAEVGDDEHHWGASLSTARRPRYGDEGMQLDLRVALELFDLDADTRGGRLAMSADW